MSRRTALLGVAAALAVGVGGCGADPKPRVPRIVGLQLRRAEDLLSRRHLRWRVAPGTKVYSHTLPADVHTSLDDIPVTGQRPAADTPTGRGGVVTIITPCTSTHPCS